MKMDRNLDIKLLVDANCLKTLEPQEVISIHGVGLYAFNAKFVYLDLYQMGAIKTDSIVTG